MSTEKSALLKRLTAKGRLNPPEGLQQSGEVSSGNDKVKVSDWNVTLGQDGMLMSGCNVTPVSTKYPIWYLNIYATATGSDKLAVAGLVGATGTSSLSGKGVSVSGWTDLYDPNIEGNVIESLIYGFVRLDDDTVENFSFEKTVVLQT